MKYERRSTARGAELRLCAPPDARLSGYVRREIVAFAQTQGIDDADVADFMNAVGEALANAVEHAQTHKPIEIAAWILDDRLFASVCDHGVGFAPNEHPAKRLPEAYAERGRGLPLMHRITDVFNVHSAPGEGTRVTLGCHVHRAAGAHAQTCA
jgi:anti-sigma regulatory factor (Ser/Thr protein kinase)